MENHIYYTNIGKFILDQLVMENQFLVSESTLASNIRQLLYPVGSSNNESMPSSNGKEIRSLARVEII